MTIISFATALMIFCTGFFTILTRRNLFKTVIGLSLMEGSLLLLIVTAGYIPDGVPPLLPLKGVSVNPLPHAFTLTAIVIGASHIALALAFVIRIRSSYRTLDIDRIRGLKE
ncbi:MAG TPA: cation:proton antiporter subunit C [Synergistales bacterium]|nr:cation:proton antiporter subunit C [Synergistales bacterium]